VRKHDKDYTVRANEVLEEYFRERQGEIEAVAEAIYHANQREWEKGVDEWIEVFNSALEKSVYMLCRALLGVRNDLTVETSFELGRLSLSEGDYFMTLARYKEAKGEYREAISAYDDALKLAPDDVNALNNKGSALQRLGDLQSGLAQHKEAMQSYSLAISAYDTALKLAPDNVYALTNKGNALQRLGDLQSALAQHKEAMQSYSLAISAYDTALKLAPDNVYALTYPIFPDSDLFCG
jgi:tetratricopeptide (TPR) repeat protein